MLSSGLIDLLPIKEFLSSRSNGCIMGDCIVNGVNTGIRNRRTSYGGVLGYQFSTGKKGRGLKFVRIYSYQNTQKVLKHVQLG